MSISNELSADVAVALVKAKDKYRGDPSGLKELILQFHSKLQQFAEESRNRRIHSQAGRQRRQAEN